MRQAEDRKTITAPASVAPSNAAAWRPALAFALASLACALLLGGLSAWFLGSVALAGLSAAAFTFNFHIPGALVRLFAIGRVATKFGERLTGHRAALEDQCRRRATLFARLSERPSLRQSGWQLGQPQALADYLDDAEDVDYARLRADLPLFTAALGTAILSGATALVAPAALSVLLVVVPALLLSARSLERAADPLWRAVHDARQSAAGRFGDTLSSVVALKAERAFSAETDTAFAALAQARRDQNIIRLRQARLDMLGALAAPVIGLSVFAAAFAAGARGEGLLLPTFLAFAWLALGEALQGLGRSILARLRSRHARLRLDEAAGTQSGEAAALSRAGLAPAVARPVLAATRLTRRAPDGRVLGAPVDLVLEAGRPLVLRGPSGCGKTSLLKQIAGWLGEDVFAAGDAPVGPLERCRDSFLCLHDAAILADTLRANLFAPDASDEALWAALAAVELADRFAACGLDGWITQDQLSLGEAQRLNLARAWLSDRPILLLDEPGEHLDEAQAQRILARLLARMRARIVVLSSHRTVAGPALRTITL